MRAKRTPPTAAVVAPVTVDDPDTAVVTDADTAPTVAADTIAEVVAGIRAAQAKHGFALVRDVGALIVAKFYGGDVGVLRERGPKDASLRKLAEHLDLAMSAASLYTAVATYELMERVGGVSTWKHLAPSHVRAVLPLPDKAQRRLLARAEDRAWTVRQLEAEARKVKVKAPKRRGGRRPLPTFVKTIRALRRFDDDALFADFEQLDALGEDDAQVLMQTVTGLKLRCEALQKRLQARVAGFGG